MILTNKSKISILISSSLILSLLILYYVNEFSRPFYDEEKLEDMWYSQEFNPQSKKIFLVGSSHVASINGTHIQEKLISQNKNYELYNLAKGVDFIEKRIPKLQNLIEADPELVVIGIRYMDFGSYRPWYEGSDLSLITKLQNQFFLENTVKTELESILHVDLNNFNNPKLTTFQIFSWAYSGKIPEPSLDSKTPFAQLWNENQLDEIYNMTSTEDFPNKNRKWPGNPHKFESNGIGVQSLKYIVENLRRENIDVLIYTTPHHKVFRDTIPIDDQLNFIKILKEIEKQYDVDVILLHDKYDDLDIWVSPDHIAKNPQAIIHSKDLAKIILEALNS